MNPRLFTFAAGGTGRWVVSSANAISGEPLLATERLEVVAGGDSFAGAAWVLRGVTSNQRYATRSEAAELAARQAPLGRSEATCGALIPIKKSAAWWALSQDERRDLFEEQSRHNAVGMKYLPAIARRLHHCRDLEGEQPFDFLTWFDYAPEHTGAFDELVGRLRESLEWKYVEREFDLRVALAP